MQESKGEAITTKKVRKVVEPFYPKPVWFRTFDIAKDELKHLEGGSIESEEINQLLGLRGIQRI